MKNFARTVLEALVGLLVVALFLAATVATVAAVVGGGVWLLHLALPGVAWDRLMWVFLGILAVLVAFSVLGEARKIG